ncbi:helix-turn-helix transcriptional regulator [Clostridium sp. HBUAS56017]|uniref:helix-turn-helix domain-containing protein n=1 Tax=Clostridium sp. HBUAS56017 TaxID=2571128 RepID=UPI001178C1A3|nr:helix-turn-helix transcriptional regulator [Clostridium sp. HBUAS56017]
MATFADRLKLLRNEKRITQEKLAEQFFITKSAISKYENGINAPENRMLQDMADFFKVSVDYLLGRSDIRKEEINNYESSYSARDKAQEILEVIKNAGIDLNNIDYEKLEQLLKLANIEKTK